MAAGGLFRLWQGYQDSQEDDEVKAAWTRLCRRNYHLHCTIKNETDSTIYFDNTYFNSGDMFIAPPDEILPRSSVTFGVGGGSYSGDALRSMAMGGVSGGARFRVGQGPAFAVGFTDPIIGYRKAGVAMEGSAEDGYDAASGDGNSATKDNVRVTATIDGDKRLAVYKVERI